MSLSCRLSRPKAAYIHDAARQTLAGVVPSLSECDELSDAEIIDRLVAIKGVGCWTVQMLQADIERLLEEMGAIPEAEAFEKDLIA